MVRHVHCMGGRRAGWATKRTANAFSEEIRMAAAPIRRAPLARAALALAFLIAPLAAAQTPPYPPSRASQEIEWHPDTVKTLGRGSGQWPAYDSVSFIQCTLTVSRVK